MSDTTLPPPPGSATVHFGGALPPGLPKVPGYEVLEELGRGGMGVVYKACQVKLDRLVALKMILSGSHAGEDDLARFKTEGEAIARLHHPNIVQIYEVGEHEGRPFFSLEYCEGGTLEKALSAGPLPAREAARLLEEMARAVQAAHDAGIVHRDLKPANVLLADLAAELGPARDVATRRDADAPSRARRLNELVPKIADFGLAKRLDQVGRTQTGAVMGTPSYMAPEQAGGHRHEVGPTTDVYALGAILYECLTGRPPFKGPTTLDTVLQVLECEPAPPRVLCPTVPRDLETIALKCLEKDPARRYTSAARLADDLQRYGAGDSISARSYNLFDRLARTLERSPIDAGFEAWGNLLLVWAGIVLLAHLLSCALIQAELANALTNTTCYGFQFACMGLTYAFLRPRTTRPTGAAEHQLRTIWGGYLIASFLLIPVWHSIPSFRAGELQWATYPFAALLAGLAFFAMGGSHWGPGYVVGVAFFALAALAPYCLTWASLGFGGLWALALAAIGLRLRRLGRSSAKAPPFSGPGP